MKKVTIFGVGNIGNRLAFFLARNRDVARIRLVDVDPKRSQGTLLDFLRSNVALRSKIAFVDYEEPKEISQSDVVIVAVGVEQRPEGGVSMPSKSDLDKMARIAEQIGHFTPQSVIAVLSQPAELFCQVIAKSGGFDASKVIGFPLLIYREWYRDYLGRLIGVSNEDIRISTVRTLRGEELVPEQCAVGGVPLEHFVVDPERLRVLPDPEVIHKRLRFHHYAPAAVMSDVTGEFVAKRRQLITAITKHSDEGAFLESKSVVGPNGVERQIPLALTPEQSERHNEYRHRVIELTRELA
ncbi:MAG: lactate/malate family dehydrogenase [Spirochaetaceae bacterium]